MGRIVGKVFEDVKATLNIEEIKELASEKGLEKLNMEQLRVLAGGKGIEVTSKLKKDELISLIIEDEEEEGE